MARVRGYILKGREVIETTEGQQVPLAICCVEVGHDAGKYHHDHH